MSIEETLSSLLHELTPDPPNAVTVEQVAQRVRDARPPRDTRRTWWVGVAAAAASVIIVAIAVVALRVTPRHGAPAVDHTPPPTSSAPTRSVSAVPTPGPALSGPVNLDGARFVLPSGWVARRLPSQASPTWCLSPSSRPPVTTRSRCELWFSQLPDPPGRRFSAMVETGYGFPVCDELSARRTLNEFAIRPFGGRAADYLQSHIRCANGAAYDITQYLIVTKPGFILYSDHASPAVRAVMATLAHDSTLPTQTAALRYTIMGDVENRTHSSAGYRVTLRPWTRLSDGQFVAIPGGTANSYVIPDSLVPDQGITLTGLIELTTNGDRVTALTIIGG